MITINPYYLGVLNMTHAPHKCGLAESEQQTIAASEAWPQVGPKAREREKNLMAALTESSFLARLECFVSAEDYFFITEFCAFTGARRTLARPLYTTGENDKVITEWRKPR